MIFTLLFDIDVVEGAEFLFRWRTKGHERRLMTFNPDDLHEFIVARAFDLLKVIRLADVQRASPGAATFYVWVRFK